MDDATLTKTICALLGELPGWAWRLTGPAYAGDDIAVFYGTIPPDPDRAVGVRVYGQVGSPSDFLIQRRVQLRSRGARGFADDADAVAGIAFARIGDLVREAGILTVHRESFTPLGADANGREQRSDNYIVILDNPEASQP